MQIRLSFAAHSYFRNLDSGINKNAVRCADVNRKSISVTPTKQKQTQHANKVKARSALYVELAIPPWWNLSGKNQAKKIDT
jgi:hypothetical protein